jgi:hypothetical protein
MRHKLDEGDEAGSINRNRVVDVLSSDWGFYTTATDNLEKLPGLVSDIDPELGRQVAKSAGELHEEVARAPKSRAFNLRAKLGGGSGGSKCRTSRSPSFAAPALGLDMWLSGPGGGCSHLGTAGRSGTGPSILARHFRGLLACGDCHVRGGDPSHRCIDR